MAKVNLTITDSEGKKHRLVLTRDDETKSILDVAEEHDIELPYSCRSGACFSCAAGVNKWNNLLEKEKTGEQLVDIEDTEVLTCICGIKKEAFEGDEDKEVEVVILN